MSQSKTNKPIWSGEFPITVTSVHWPSQILSLSTHTHNDNFSRHVNSITRKMCSHAWELTPWHYWREHVRQGYPRGRKGVELLHDMMQGRDYGQLKDLISDRLKWRQDSEWEFMSKTSILPRAALPNLYPSRISAIHLTSLALTFTFGTDSQRCPAMRPQCARHFWCVKLKLLATTCDTSGFQRLFEVFLYSPVCSLAERRLELRFWPTLTFWHDTQCALLHYNFITNTHIPVH